MKILAVTDLHGAYEVVGKILQHEEPDVMVIGGDLTTAGTVKEAEDAIGKYRTQVRHIVCVAGNMDSPAHDEMFVRQGISINGTAVIIEDIGFFGVSGAPYSVLHTPYEISEDEILSRARIGFDGLSKADVRLSVFVPHAPPHGTSLDKLLSGQHVGSTAVREFVLRYQPSLVICGHIHEASGEEMLGSSRVINCGPASKGHYAIITAGNNLSVLLKRSNLFP